MIVRKHLCEEIGFELSATSSSLHCQPIIGAHYCLPPNQRMQGVRVDFYRSCFANLHLTLFLCVVGIWSRFINEEWMIWLKQEGQWGKDGAFRNPHCWRCVGDAAAKQRTVTLTFHLSYSVSACFCAYLALFSFICAELCYLAH